MTILTNRKVQFLKIIEKAKTEREFTGTKILQTEKLQDLD
jgi:hypothetical protein